MRQTCDTTCDTRTVKAVFLPERNPLPINNFGLVDQCYVGSAPGLIYGGSHGPDEKQVFEDLCAVVEEAIELYRADGKPLPPPTAGRDFANRMQSVA